MEERSEILEMLIKRWLGYYSDKKLYDSCALEVEGADRMSLKYTMILSELTHIISKILEKSYEETYSILLNNFRKMKEMEGIK